MAENAASGQRPIDRRILEEAAKWFMRLEAGEITEDAPDYRAWFDACEDHQDAMIRARITWGVVGDHARSPELMTAKRDALNRSTDHGESRWQAFSAAPKSFGWGLRAVAAAIVIGLIAAPLLYMQLRDAPVEQALAQVYVTDVAETRAFALADNSRVTLDAQSRIEVRYSAIERDIVLVEGQAHFDVAKDETRPFRVTAGDRTVIATGTSFNVEMVGEEVFVTLLEGEVIVTEADEEASVLSAGGLADDPGGDEAPAASVRLAPGQQLFASTGAAPRIEAAPNIEKTNAWRRGKVFLEEDRLSVAVARINRYSRVKLRIADEELKALEVGGVFNAGDTDAFVEALEAAFDIDARRLSSTTIELRGRES